MQRRRGRETFERDECCVGATARGDELDYAVAWQGDLAKLPLALRRARDTRGVTGHVVEVLHHEPGFADVDGLHGLRIGRGEHEFGAAVLERIGDDSAVRVIAISIPPRLAQRKDRTPVEHALKFALRGNGSLCGAPSPGA
jgi:hypothetical protein